MRWFKFIIVILTLLGLIYLGAVSNYDNKKKIVLEQEIPYPVEKLFPQFSNFQNFTRWNQLFLSNGKYTYTYFLPYEGANSSMSFVNVKNKKDYGQIYIHHTIPNKGLKYEVYERENSKPYKVDINFVAKGDKTRVAWHIEIPGNSLLDNFMESISEEKVKGEVNRSIRSLINLLSGKVNREVMLSQIKYDSIMVEQQKERLLLGLNVSTSNQRGSLFRNININHNKVMNFLAKDLGKNEDEYGLPMFITDIGGLRNKEISYFYGFPLSKQEKIGDNNFVYNKLARSDKAYTIYYQGKYDQRIVAIDKLLSKMKKDSLKGRMIEEIFIEYPREDKDVTLKISVPVFK